MSEEEKDKCPPSEVKIKVEQSSAKERIDTDDMSQSMAKTLLIEAFRRKIRDPEGYTRSFRILAFLLRNNSIDFSQDFLDIMELEDMVVDMEGYEQHCNEARREHMQIAQTIPDGSGGYRYEDDLNEHKQAIKDLANKLNLRLFEVMSEHFETIKEHIGGENIDDIFGIERGKPYDE